MENTKKINNTQKQFLAMEENVTFLFGKFSNENGKTAKDAKWADISEKLNSLGPPNKTKDKWKKV